MRKNSPRKWLHACLDLLPVILIPVFMIYSHRHDVTENVQINYKYQSNVVNSLDDLVEGNIYQIDILDIDNYTFEWHLPILQCDSFTINDYEDVVYEETYLEDYDSRFYNSLLLDSYSNILFVTYTNDNAYVNISYSNYEFVANNVVFLYDSSIYTIFNFYNLIPQYTDYNVIESVDIENTDVMDSFMNHFNNTIERHFNMGNVFNLNGVYQWFNTNIFHGNAPQVIYSVWNIALYELVMDLLFLLYGLFMWFIDMVEHLMDKPFKSIK